MALGFGPMLALGRHLGPLVGPSRLFYLRLLMHWRQIHSLAFLVAWSAIGGVTGQEPVRSAAGGPRVFSFPNEDQDRFGLVVMVGVGSRDDAPVFAGSAKFLERVISRAPIADSGPGSDAELIQRRIRKGGGTHLEHTLYELSGKVEDWRFMVQWLGDRVTQPCFSPQHVEYERQLLLAEIWRASAAGSTTIEGELYPGHPLARSISGQAAAVQQISGADLQMLHRQYYHTGNVVIGFSGGGFDDRVTAECRAAIKSAFAGLGPGVRDVAAMPPVQCVGTRLLFPQRSYGRGGWLLTGFHLEMPEGREAVGSCGERLARLHVLTSYLSRRFAAVAREGVDSERSSSVDLVTYRDAQRLDFVSKVHDPSDMQDMLSRVDGLLAELSVVDTDLLERVKEDRSKSLTVRSGDDLAAAVQLAAWLTWSGSDLEEYADALAEVGAGTLLAVADAELQPNLRFTLSDVPQRGGESWLGILLALLLVLLAIDWFMGFECCRRVVAALSWPFRRQVTGSGAGPAGGTVAPVDGDQVERDIQRYFAEEDRSRGGR